MTYFLGHIIQAFGKWYESTILVKRWGGKPSTRFILDSDDHYSTEFKVRILEAVRNRFGFPIKKDEMVCITTDKQRNEVFGLCYSYISERDLGSMASLMNITYGLFRGLVVTCALSVPLFLGAAGILYAKHANTHAIASAIIGLTFIGLAVLFDRRLKQRGELFADKVYQSFLASIKIEKREIQ